MPESSDLLRVEEPVAPRRRPGRPGRPTHRTPEATRETILDAAEELFARNGYDGTSIRDVAAASGLQIAAIGYHFGAKDELFDSVIARRAAVMTMWRARALEEMRAEHGERAISLDALVRAYVRPFFESANHGDAGWRNYAALMGRLANSAQGTEVIAKHYDETARAYVGEFARALPGVANDAVVDGFMFMVASMLTLCAATGRAARLGEGKRAAQSLSAAFDHLVAFLVAGFRALPRATPASRPTRVPRARRAESRPPSSARKPRG